MGDDFSDICLCINCKQYKDNWCELLKEKKDSNYNGCPYFQEGKIEKTIPDIKKENKLIESNREKLKAGLYLFHNGYTLFLDTPTKIDLTDEKGVEIETFNFKTLNIQLLNKIANTLQVLGVFKELEDAKQEVRLCFKHYKQTQKSLIEESLDNINDKQFFLVNNFVENITAFYNYQPFFYDTNGIFWMWNLTDKKYEMVDEIDLMNMVDDKLKLNGQTVGRSMKSDYLEAFKRVGRKQKPENAPEKWIQFKNKIFDIEKNNIFDADPKYFMCNPIPWELGKTTDTPIIDKLFTEWVGEDYVQTLYEIVAYCCLTDYPISIIFCLIGGGRNGKTKFQGLIQRFIGIENICSTELDLLIDNRFESAKLFKKLVCTMGETNFGTLKRTSLLKKLSGGDLIGFEFKNKKPFDDYNYAKIIINSNSLPNTEDTSEGFYRRWMIIDFPNQFPEGKDILKTIPQIEYNNLALKIVKLIPKLLKKGNFKNQGTIIERQMRYTIASNPLSIFIDNCCHVAPHNFSRHFEIYNAYLKFLIKLKRRPIKRKEFNELLAEEGLESHRTTKTIKDEYLRDWYIECVTLTDDWEEKLSTLSSLSTSFTISSPIGKSKVKNTGQSGQSGYALKSSEKDKQEEFVFDEAEKKELIIMHCYYCNKLPCVGYSRKGRPMCENCYENKHIIER